jgi:hypothetical protein
MKRSYLKQQFKQGVAAVIYLFCTDMEFDVWGLVFSSIEK